MTEQTTPEATLRDQIRRALCEADGFDYATIEPDEYTTHADAVLALLPDQLAEQPAAAQRLLDAGESCLDGACQYALDLARIEKDRYAKREHVSSALEELDDLIADGAVSADRAHSLRSMLRDALGLS
jgi:hypothetical protein